MKTMKREAHVTLVDITKNGRLVKKINESEERFKELADLLPQIVFEIDLRGHFTFVNRVGFESTGYSQEDFEEALTVFQILVPGDRDRVRRNIERIFSGEKLGETEYTALRKDGSTFPIKVFSSPIIRGNKPVGLRGFAIDITNLKQVEDENLARFPLENPNPILRIAADWTILFTNPAAKPLLDEWKSGIGQPVPEDWRLRLADAFSSGQRKDFEVKHGDKTISFMLVPIKDQVYVNAYGRNTTHRKQLEQTLQESEEKYRALVENSPNLVSIYQEGYLKYVNETMCKKLGWTFEELTSPAFNVIERLIPERFQALVKENIAKRLDEEAIAPYEINLKTRDNIVFPVTVQAQRILCKGKPAVELIITDITERKRMEEELKEKASLLDAATDSISLRDFDGNYLYVNEATSKQRGYTRDELLKMSVHDMLVLENTAFFKSRIEELIEKGEIIYEDIVIRKDKSLMPVEVHSRTIEMGDRTLILTVSRDIIERKKAEEQLRLYSEHLEELVKERTRKLRDSEAFKSNVLESINDAVLVINPDFKIVSANKAALEQVRMEKDKVVGKHCYEVTHHRSTPCEAPDNICPIWTMMETGKSEIVEHTHYDKEGNKFHVEVSASPIKDAEGNIIHIVHVARDITEHKRLETQLLKSERLAAIGEVAGMVGHDLRNPLQVIVNTLYVAGKNVESIKDREIVEKIGFLKFKKVLEEQMEYMNSLVSNLQEYARLLKPKLVETDLRPLINSIFSTIAVPENIAVSTFIEDDFPLLMIDSLMMRRVFTNLVSNAVQAMPEGGKLTIKASKTEEDGLISVEDTGVGIPQENLSKLFGPLFTTKAKGTGFGLSVCKQIVEVHGGRIIVESEVGKCSAFTIRIPLNGGEQE